MTTRRLLCLLICLITVATSCSGCFLRNLIGIESDSSSDGSAADNSSEVSDTSEENNTLPEFLELVTDGVAVDVVYPTVATSSEITLATKVVDLLKALGKAKAYADDESSKHDPDLVEIVIGYTAYPESRTAFEELGYGEGVIRIIGNKLIIIANSESAYSALSAKISVALRSGTDENNNIRISSDYSVSVVDNQLVSTIPVMDDLSLNDVKDGGDGSYVLTFKKGKTSSLDNYIKKLTDNGYEEYAGKTVDGNRYHTLINQDNVITAIYTSYNKEIKVIVEKLSDTSLPTKAADNNWTALNGVSTTITQIGLHSDSYSGEERYNGLSLVIRLADGSFIVIDGGHNNTQDVEKLYKVLEKQSEDRDIVIAAWIFTHDHGDHTGFFKKFCQSYASKVTVERFIYNFPSLSELGENATGLVGSNIIKYFKSSEIVKAHPGQEFYLRNAKIDMLFTNDVWDHNSQALKTQNEASLVFTVELEGKKLMILGDHYEDRGTLQKLYNEKTLKSDIMQVSHHGISNCGTNLYPMIAPEWVLWPLGDDLWINETENRYISEHPINAYMKTMDQNKVFMALDDIVILTIDNGNISSQVFETDAIYLAS